MNSTGKFTQCIHRIASGCFFSSRIVAATGFRSAVTNTGPGAEAGGASATGVSSIASGTTGRPPEQPRQFLQESLRSASPTQPARSPPSDPLAFELPSRALAHDVYTQVSFEPLDRIYLHRLRLIFRQIDPTAAPPLTRAPISSTNVTSFELITARVLPPTPSKGNTAA